MKYLPIYKAWMKTGKMDELGLCIVFERDELFVLMKPTHDERVTLGKERLPSIYWGRGEWESELDSFTPLRQNIVLFMAAMNGEL